MQVERLSGQTLPGALSYERDATVSAYVDDINIFVASQGDVQLLE